MQPNNLKIINVEKKKSYVVEITGKSTFTRVTVYNEEGIEHTSVTVESRALPDERQVGMSATCAGELAVVHAQQAKEPPEARPVDPNPGAHTKIAGDLCGKCVILTQKHHAGTLLERVMKCTGGFGCNADGYGRKLFGEMLHSGEDYCGRRESAARFATNAEFAGALELRKGAKK